MDEGRRQGRSDCAPSYSETETIEQIVNLRTVGDDADAVLVKLRAVEQAIVGPFLFHRRFRHVFHQHHQQLLFQFPAPRPSCA